MNSEPNWTQAAQQMQETLGAGFQQALAAIGTVPVAGFPQMDLAAFKPSAGQAQPSIRFEPSKLLELQQNYIAGATALWNQGLKAGESATATLADRRFSDPAWQANPVSKFLSSAYQLNASTLMGMVDAVESDAKTKARLRFAVEQWMAASSPSNFLALNAEAQKKAIETRGESIAKGLANMLHDMKQGHVSMTDESVFEVGKNVATTEGAVVFENEFFQLLEYKALTDKVYEKPFLMVPPCINKFYILDLQPENSLIRYATSQGHRTFVLSWRNPDQSMADKTWDDYIEHAAIKAIDVVRD
ncbi:MAG: poly(R)-hydroxyalkanoic acid synthase, class, partial [Polaromonas sp.]|nr:poly(R)-hydroxyalkanoic acid synthase, class [Polaromonas sp.]